MPDKCTEQCPDLARLEQQVKDLQKQNGADHKEVRDRLTKLEKEEAVQEEQYKTILGKLDDLTDSHKELNKRLSELESKPGKKWDKLSLEIIGAVALAIVAFLLGRVGL